MIFTIHYYYCILLLFAFDHSYGTLFLTTRLQENMSLWSCNLIFWRKLKAVVLSSSCQASFLGYVGHFSMQIEDHRGWSRMNQRSSLELATVSRPALGIYLQTLASDPIDLHDRNIVAQSSRGLTKRVNNMGSFCPENMEVKKNYYCILLETSFAVFASLWSLSWID